MSHGSQHREFTIENYSGELTIIRKFY